jgi:hypothetical protein
LSRTLCSALTRAFTYDRTWFAKVWVLLLWVWHGAGGTVVVVVGGVVYVAVVAVGGGGGVVVGVGVDGDSGDGKGCCWLTCLSSSRWHNSNTD